MSAPLPIDARVESLSNLPGDYPQAVAPIDDGGPVHPVTRYQRVEVGENRHETVNASHNGMSLRDQFATNVSWAEVEALAPSTAKGCVEFLGLPEGTPWDNRRFVEIVAVLRYRIADAMLVARKAPVQP